MSVPREVLIACIEDAMFRIRHDAPDVVPLHFEGVRGRRTPIPVPLENLMGVSAPGASIPDASIESVFAEFAHHRSPFGWLVGPHSPPDLPERLEERGMRQLMILDGLACEADALDLGNFDEDGIFVREVAREEAEVFAELFERAYQLPTAVVRAMCDALYLSPMAEVLNLFGFDAADPTTPIAVSSSVKVPEVPVIILAGAAVLEDFRGRGLYRALMRARFDAMPGMGAEAAVIQASQGTSSPICRRLGFTEICTQTVYGWYPTSLASARERS